jgi:hypothetical protein
MKRLVVVVIFFLAILPACNKDEKFPEWMGIGTIEKANASSDEFAIALDGGDRLLPNNIVENNTLEDGDRVVVSYSVTKTIGNGDFEVDLYDLDVILIKEIIQLTEAIQDSIGNDPIYVKEDNIWIADNYLNFVFEYYGQYKIHYINLVKLYEDTHTEDGRLILEFRHNGNDDFSSNLQNGVVSFNLEGLKEVGEDSVEFLVRVKEYDDEILEWEGSYTFNSSEKSSQFAWPKNKKIELFPNQIK